MRAGVTSLFGTAVHAVLRTPSSTPDGIRAALERAGIAVHSITPVAPSLEDVFLDVIDRARARGGSAA